MPKYRFNDLNGETWFAPGGPVGLKYVRGIEGGSFEHQTIKGPTQRGVTWMGTELDRGQVALGVLVHPARRGITGQAAVNILSEWRDGLGEGEAERDGNPMTLELVDTGRYQALRLAERPDPANWDQMRYAGFWLDEIVLQADDPDWYSDPQTYTFTPAQFAGAAIDNPGTVDAWIGMKLTGPITNPVVGIGDDHVKVPNLAAGQWMQINTDPNWYEVSDQAGLDRTFELVALAGTGNDDRWRTQAKARAAAIPVNIAGTGTSGATKLDVIVPRIYRSAL